MKKITFDEFIDYMENKGFSCNGYNNGAYEFETYSAAGCDIIITVSSKETAVKDIAENAESFDVDEFVRGSLNAKEHGANGVPNAVTLAKDAQGMLMRHRNLKLNDSRLIKKRLFCIFGHIHSYVAKTAK